MENRALGNDSRVLWSLMETDYKVIADPESLSQVPKEMRQLPGEVSQARLVPTR